MTTSVWSPRFTITPSISDNQKRIEMARILLETVILPLEGDSVLRDRAHVRASYASSLMGGGHLTLEQAAELIANETIEIKGLENDASVVHNYRKALQKAEEWAKMSLPLTETLISRFHRLAMTGKSSRPTPLRKSKSVLKSSLTGDAVYLPPRPEDLDSYYRALKVNENIDYYEGLADADLTSWLEYYIGSLVHSCDVTLGEIVAYIASTPAKSRRKRKKTGST